MPLDRSARIMRAAWVAWALALLVLGARAAGWPRVHSCYPIFEHAALRWQAGTDLYAPSSADDPGKNHDVYRYSPLVAVFFVPLSQLPASIANLLWRLINAGALLGGLAWCGRTILPREWGRTQYGLLFLAALPISADALHNGQSNVLVIGLLLICLAAIQSQRWNVAAACAATATLFKLYPLAFALLLVPFHPRRFGVRLVMALAVGLLLPFLLQSPAYVTSQYTSWLHHLHANDRHLLSTDLWYRDLRLLCSLAGAELSYTQYQLVEAILGAGMVLFCLAGWRAGWSERVLLLQVLGLGSCWMTVFGPATESSTYSLLAPTAAWLSVEAWQPGRYRLRATVGAAYVLLLVPHVFSWFPGPKVLLVQGLQPLAGLLLLGVVLLLGLKAMRRPAVSRGAAAEVQPLVRAAG